MTLRVGVVLAAGLLLQAPPRAGVSSRLGAIFR